MNGNTLERLFDLAAEGPRLIADSLGIFSPQPLDKEKRLHAIVGGWPWTAGVIPLLLPNANDRVFWCASAGEHADLIGLTPDGGLVAAELKRQRAKAGHKDAIAQALRGLARGDEWSGRTNSSHLVSPWRKHKAKSPLTAVLVWDMGQDGETDPKSVPKNFRRYIEEPERIANNPNGTYWSTRRFVEHLRNRRRRIRLVTAAVGVQRSRAALRIGVSLVDHGAM